MGLTQAALAMGVQRKHVNELCNNRRAADRSPLGQLSASETGRGQVCLAPKNSGTKPFRA
jgi:hypothetical protein